MNSFVHKSLVVAAALILAASLSACDSKGSKSEKAKNITELYISKTAGQSVLLFNATEGKITREIKVGMLPHNFKLSLDASKFYVVLTGSQAIAELNTATGEVLRTFLTEPVPKIRADNSVIQGHIDKDAFSHTTCYDCHRAGSGGPTPAIVGSRPFGIVISKDGNTMYVSNGRSGNLSVIDIATGALKKLVPLPPSGTAREPTDIALLDDQLFVTLRPPLPSTAAGAVRRLDVDSLSVLSDTPTGANAGVILADAGSHQIYASNFETNTISRFDTKGVLLQTVTVGSGPFGLRFLPEQKQMIVANYYANSISLINLADNQTQTIPLTFNGKTYANPTHVALDANRRTAFIVSSGTVGNLLTFDLQTQQVTRAVPIGSLPFDIMTVPK